MTTAKPFQHFDMFGGMDYTTRPHLLSPQHWRMLRNMRCNGTRIEQFPQPVVFGHVLPHSASTLIELANLPAGVSDVGTLVGLTETQVFKVGAAYSKPLQQFGAALTLNSDSQYRRWGTCVHNNFLFFTNELNAVRYTDGVEVRPMGASTLGAAAAAACAPSGRYVLVFYDHLVVGAPTFQGIRQPNWIMWSHLHDYANFVPGTSSEADHYICSEFQRQDNVVDGITGMVLYKNYCLIFTYSCVYAMRYTGLPRVVNVQPIIQDYGCGYPYTVAQLNDAIVWLDHKHQNFFAFRGAGPEPFGDAIWDYFSSDINTDFNLASRLWTYVDQASAEVGWVYCSTASTGAFDKAVVFNYGNKSWSVRDMQNVHCRVSAGRRAVTGTELKLSASAYTTQTANDLVISTETFGILWGGAGTILLSEENASTASADVLTSTVPQLETGDYTYGSFAQVKEIAEMYLSCNSSVAVSVSQRKFPDSSVSYTSMGTWTSTIAQERLTFKTQAGKVLRYKFVPTATGSSIGTVWYTSIISDFDLRTDYTVVGTPATDTLVIDGDPNETYVLEVYIRGGFEFHRYTGGTTSGYVNTGGAPNASDGDRTIVKLEISSPATELYLNAVATAPGAFSTFVAYRARITVKGGATLTLSMYKDAGVALYKNDAGGALPEVDEVTGVDGEFCQINFISTNATDIMLTKGGNVRNFLFTGFEDNILNFEAIK